MNARIASAGAVVAGLVVAAGAPTIADTAMYGSGIFTHGPKPMADQLFALAAAYRAIFAAAGGYATARLAPERPMLHAWILAGLGVAAGLAGIGAQMSGGSSLGPMWYAIVVAAEAIPCVYLGARIAVSRRLAVRS